MTDRSTWVSLTDKFFLLVDTIQMYSEFVGYYNTYNKKSKVDEKPKKLPLSPSQPHVPEKTYESTITLSKDEVVYMREFDENLCFLVHIHGEYIENKTLLNINLDTLKKYIMTLFNSMASHK